MNGPLIGLVEWFEIGEEERVDRVLERLRQLGVEHLRTAVSWADWHAEGGRKWYDWLLPRLAAEVELLPCVAYGPPSLGVAATTEGAPPPGEYAEFVGLLLARYGEHFEHVELRNEPADIRDSIVRSVRGRGKRIILGGKDPLDPDRLALLAERGVLERVDAIGLHGFTGTSDVAWDGWAAAAAEAQRVLEEHGVEAEIWITEASYSTWRNDEFGQVRGLVSALEAPVERIYWYAAEDPEAGRAANGDERHSHAGIYDAEGEPKLLARLWGEGGLELVRETARLGSRPLRPVRSPTTLVTGGAGFVGTNLVHRRLAEGKRVRVLDNLSRPGVERNLRWLAGRHPGRLEVVVGDVRDPLALERAVRDVDEVFHLAAQVAVTTSLERPERDFAVNLVGTIQLLEALRRLPKPPPILFTSTNKVYGSLDELELELVGDRWLPRDPLIRARGIDERRPLDFCTPYGCSKGAADQYVLDYAASFEMPSVVFRMSCIYGPHQHGNEDQGWVAHFLLRVLAGEAVTIYGDGCQVRDVLYVDDLVDAMLLARRHVYSPELLGQAFNIGGGPPNAVSLVEVLDVIAGLHGERPEVELAAPRKGDQRYYVSNTRRFGAATGWEPRVSPDEGIDLLYQWLVADTGARRAKETRLR